MGGRGSRDHDSSSFSEAKTSESDRGDDGPMKHLDSYLTRAEECLEAVKKMPPRNFNLEQCEYLADKLEEAVQRARVFLEEDPLAIEDIGRIIAVFEVLFASAEHVQSFIQGCSEVKWIQASMTLSRMSEYVSWIGFNLKLCDIAFCENNTGTGSLSLDQVQRMNTIEVEDVDRRASADLNILFEKVVSQMPLLNNEEKDLAVYVIHRIKGIKPVLLSNFLGSNLEVIGRGGFSTVYRGMWLGIPFARRMFHGNITDLGSEVEVGILQGLCHPNVTSYFCSSMDNRGFSIIMELMDEDLSTLIRRRLENHFSPFKILEGVDIMLQISEGVTYIHRKNIVHKDLKSSNILVKSEVVNGSKSRYVKAKLAGFGLLKKKDYSLQWSTKTFNTGTSRWMAPELIRFSHHSEKDEVFPKYPFKCDVHSFAMLCYEILTGEFPFHNDPPHLVKKKILDGVRPNLPRTHCPRQLQLLIERCWSQTPTERPSFPNICLELKHIKSILMTHTSSISSMSFSTLDLGFNHGPLVTNEESLQAQNEKEKVQTSTDRVFDSTEFHIGRQLGKGASASVNEVVWQGCNYAMKTFYQGLDPPEFNQEVSMLQGLSHPNIVSIHDWGKSRRKHSCYIVMDLMDKSLFHFMFEDCHDTPPFTIPEAINIMLQTAHGVNYMHEKNIVHRDLKAENVLVKRGGSCNLDLIVKVADFGMAVIKEQSRRASDLPSVGTGRWMAPEIMTLTPGKKLSPLQGEMSRPFKCDVYSFAIVCSEILTGKLPFSNFANSQIKSLKQAVAVEGLRPKLPPYCPPGLRALIEKCWHKNPDIRPKFNEICQELECLQASLVPGNGKQMVDAASTSAGMSSAHLGHNMDTIKE